MTNVVATPSIGSVIVNKNFPRITRTTLALYAGASGDHNPMHIDIDLVGAGANKRIVLQIDNAGWHGPENVSVPERPQPRATAGRTTLGVRRRTARQLLLCDHREP